MHSSLTAVGETVIQRVTYSIAGQATAVRVSGDPEAANNGLFYIHSDHLGSTSVLTKYSDGYIVSSSLTRYTPFGGYRSGGPNQITDRAFTGQKENMALGLYYYNARYYAPSLGRFLSADTLVPDPQNPQSLNRYTYTLNSPLNFSDPTGHNECGVAGTICDDVPISPVNILSKWDRAGYINDPDRAMPLVIPISDVGKLYVMPVDSQQSTLVQDSTWVQGGTKLAELGVGLDMLEMILATSPDPGAGASIGAIDAVVTYGAGALSGENYFPWDTPPNLPPMVAINQDVLVNGGEAIIGGSAPLVFASLGATVTVETGPGGMVMGGGTGFMLGKITDAITSGASALYDFGRVNGSFHNYLTIGISENGLTVVYWPTRP